MYDEFGLKELYQVIIRATYPIEVSGKTLEPGEVVAAFDKIQIANIQEIKSTAIARGGWDNRAQVYWDSTREVVFNFTQGIFSKSQLVLMTAAKLLEEKNNGIVLHYREQVESNENGIITLKKAAINPIFVYKVSTGDKLEYTVIDSTHLQINTSYLDCIVDYSYQYNSSYQSLVVGQALTTGYLTLEGKTRVKDDITGQTHTGILYIPRLKLTSNLSMRLGANAMPQVGRFDAVAWPIGDRRNTEVMHLTLLDDDIDSDM